MRRLAGFRWALTAAVLPLAIFVLGTPHYLIGQGLGEISSMGLISTAALFALHAAVTARRGEAVAAGLFATLAFARLSNLPMALGTAVFALGHSRRWWRPAATIVSVVGLGVCSSRGGPGTTGVFSIYGAQRDLLCRSGSPRFRSPRSFSGWPAVMVLTVNDPARFDVVAAPVCWQGALRRGACDRASATAARPSATGSLLLRGDLRAPGRARFGVCGRFSMHILPITCALAACGLAVVLRRPIPQPDGVPR